MATIIPFDRTQAFLLSPDLKDCFSQDDLAHFIAAAAERVPLNAFEVSRQARGKSQYHPQLLLAC